MSSQKRKIDISQMVSPFLVLYILHGTQMGEGVLTFTRRIAKVAGYDAWIGILLTWLLTTIIIVIVWKIVPDGQDLIDIHHSIFGKRFGNLLSLLFGVHLLSLSFYVMRSYIEVIQVWYFQDLSIGWFSLFLYILILYLVLGGFRTVVGFIFFSFWIPLVLSFSILIAFQHGHMENLLPIMNTSYWNIVKSVEPMATGYLGIELILMFAPFIHKFHKGLKWAVSANGLTTLIYLLVALSNFVYFNQEQIQLLAWPSLHVWKIISFPLIERFEYVGISLHFIVIIATSCIYFWGSVQCYYRISKVSFRGISIFLAIIGFISMFLVKDYLMIEQLSNILSKIGFCLLFIYIPFLYILKLIKSGVTKSHETI